MKTNLIIFIIIITILPAELFSQILNPGDGVRITFLNIQDEITGDYFVQQDGNIQLPFIGLVTTTNIDYKKLKKRFIIKYSEFIKTPQ